MGGSRQGEESIGAAGRPTVPSGGLSRMFYDLRRRRERQRQFVGILFVVVVTFAGRPDMRTFVPALWIVGVGMLVRLWASGHVKKDKELATEGPYALVRHPLYVGNLLIGIGFCLASGLWWSWAVWAVVLLLFYPPAIRQEDAKLRHLFGEAWDRWRAKTLALVPTWPPAGPLFTPWSARQSLIANGEPIYIVIFCLLLLWLGSRL